MKALSTYCAILPVGPASVNDRVTKARQLVAKAASSLFVARVSKHVGKKTGISKSKVLAAPLLAYNKVTDIALHTILPRELASWCGLTSSSGVGDGDVAASA